MQDHSTPVTPATFTPRHPLVAGELCNDDLDIRDALNNGAATLYMLAELFVGDDESDTRLNFPMARRGMFLQLQGVAELLTAIERALGSRVSEPEPARPEPEKTDPAVSEKAEILGIAFGRVIRDFFDTQEQAPDLSTG